MKHEAYQDWTNWNTWCVASWLDNEEYIYTRALHVAQQARDAIRCGWKLHSLVTGGAMPSGFYQDFGRHSYNRVNWTEIAEGFKPEEGWLLERMQACVDYIAQHPNENDYWI